MENLDLIILTTIVVILFMVFILATFKEIWRMQKNHSKEEKKEGPVPI